MRLSFFTIIYITTAQTDVLFYIFYNRYSKYLKLINHVPSAYTLSMRETLNTSDIVRFPTLKGINDRY